jgi:hypothetical protein
MKHACTALALAITFLGPEGAAEAAHADSPDARNSRALARLADGSWSQADLALIKSQPKIAGQVLDPSRPPEVNSGTKDEGRAPAYAGADTAALAATSCKSYWTNYSYYSLLGSTIYPWQKFVSVCYNGSIVTSVTERYDSLPARQPMIVIRERTTDMQSGQGTWQYTTRIQRHLEYCIAKYGCYADTYPWAHFKIYGNGTWSYQGADS